MTAKHRRILAAIDIEMEKRVREWFTNREIMEKLMGFPVAKPRWMLWVEVPKTFQADLDALVADGYLETRMTSLGPVVRRLVPENYYDPSI